MYGLDKNLNIFRRVFTMSESLSKDLNLNALFIGDKAENGQIYKALLNELVDGTFEAGVKTTCLKTCLSLRQKKKAVLVLNTL